MFSSHAAMVFGVMRASYTMLPSAFRATAMSSPGTQRVEISAASSRFWRVCPGRFRHADHVALHQLGSLVDDVVRATC